MLKQFVEEIEAFGQEIPNWDEDVSRFLTDEDGENSDESGEIAFQKLTELLNSIISRANKQDLDAKDVSALFEKYKSGKYAANYINKSMRIYNKFGILRKLEGENIYKAKQCIDFIWINYILRYTPNIKLGTDTFISEDEYFVIASLLDSFTEMCIRRQLSYEGICNILSEDSGMSSAICQYFAGKIDNDFEKLKLNYIIKKISSDD